MPRRPRLDLPGVPLHITHRGVNRCAIFIDEEDRHHYLRLRGLFARENNLAIHAYVLMGNHVHLLAGSTLAGAAASTLRRTTQCYEWKKGQVHFSAHDSVRGQPRELGAAARWVRAST